MNAATHSALQSCADGAACGLCHNNLVLPGINLAIMLTMKAASQSICNAVRRAGLPLQFYSKRYVEGLGNNYRIAAVVRHPLDRLVSCWRQKTVGNYHRTWPLYGFEPEMPFADFARRVCEVPPQEADKHFRPMSLDLIGADGPIYQRLVRFEHLPGDWRALAETTGGALPARLDHQNRTEHQPWVDYYDRALLARVADYYLDDLINFNYGVPKWH